MSRLLRGPLIDTKHRKRASQKPKKVLKKMSRENEFKIIPTINTKRHKKTNENAPKNIF